MTTTISVADIARNPTWHLYDIDLQRGELHFLETTPETFTISAFLDNRIAHTRERLCGFDIDSVITAFRQLPPQQAQMDFLFHSSFCCSSLLARSLQFKDRTLVLREPWVLRRLSDIRRARVVQGQVWGDQGKALVDLALTLLGKTFNASQSVLIKPTHVANNLASDMLALRSSAKGILLYSGLESFLVSNLKKPEETKEKLPALARIFDLETGYARRFEHLSIENLGFLQLVVIVWHAQMLMFQELLSSQAGPRLATLDSATLLADPTSTLEAATQFLGYPVGRGELAAIVAGPTWGTHAKDPFSAYSLGMRENENREITERHSAEIRYVMRWAEKLFASQPHHFPPERALVTAA